MDDNSSRHRVRKSKEKCVQNVVNCRACCGCGACSVVCPVHCIDFVYGNRFNYPKVDDTQCIECGKCLQVCPSVFLLNGIDPGFTDDVTKADYDCHLLHYKEDDVRMNSSSGGFITGIILHLMENGRADGAIVARSNPERPLISESLIATDKETLLSAQASRYAPVSSCTVLSEVLTRPGRYVFVGTPCMIQGVTRLQGMFPELKERIILKIGFVCAGMPSHESTKAYLERYGVNLGAVRRIYYRGGGWPGSFRVYGDHGLVLKRKLLGDELEHLVPRDHYLRCWNCLDHWSYYADVAVSDPWCEDMVENERKGWSAVMVRTEQGKQAVASAIESGDMIARSITMNDMLAYNKHLIVNSHHSQHAWMAVYQFLFHGRIRKPFAVLRSLVNRKGIGFKTTVRARFNRCYYECE